MKYVDTKIVFQELPNEITLAINISGCPCACIGCHSSYLSQDIGESLTKEALQQLIRKNKGITAISFMGGDANPAYINKLAEYLYHNYPNLKIGWDSGRDRHGNIHDRIHFPLWMEESGFCQRPVRLFLTNS